VAHDHGYRAATLSLLLRTVLCARGYVFRITGRATVSADNSKKDWTKNVAAGVSPAKTCTRWRLTAALIPSLNDEPLNPPAIVSRLRCMMARCSGGGASLSLSNRSAAEFAPRRWPARLSRPVVSLCPKQLPWKLLAQFSLSRTRCR
jgi:hypothetical protein